MRTTTEDDGIETPSLARTPNNVGEGRWGRERRMKEALGPALEALVFSCFKMRCAMGDRAQVHRSM